jgi:hypothetical protein
MKIKSRETKISRKEKLEKNLEIKLRKKICEVTPKNLEIFFLEIYQVYESKNLEIRKS